MSLSFDRDALIKNIRVSDGALFQKLDVKSKIASRAADHIRNNLAAMQLDIVHVKKKPTYHVRGISYSVIVRRLNTILKLTLGPRQPDRDAIIRQLATILREGVTHRVYKFDIKSFFESVDIDQVVRDLTEERIVPRVAIGVLEDYAARLKSLGLSGLPRGLALSSTLAECALRSFDAHTSRLPEVYFYARYVDDIVIVTSGRENKVAFEKLLKKKLPIGLIFNSAKTAIKDIEVHKKSNGQAILASFDYLGYRINVHETKRNKDNKLMRDVTLTIAPKKLTRLKSRICSAILDHVTRPNFTTLVDRLKLLSGNYNRRDLSTGASRNIGLYCNYRRATSSHGLAEVDRFLRSTAVGSRSRISRKLAAVSSVRERRKLLQINFEASFNSKTFYNFPISCIIELSNCWRDV